MSNRTRKGDKTCATLRLPLSTLMFVVVGGPTNKVCRWNASALNFTIRWSTKGKLQVRMAPSCSKFTHGWHTGDLHQIGIAPFLLYSDPRWSQVTLVWPTGPGGQEPENQGAKGPGGPSDQKTKDQWDQATRYSGRKVCMTSTTTTPTYNSRWLQAQTVSKISGNVTPSHPSS